MSSTPQPSEPRRDKVEVPCHLVLRAIKALDRDAPDFLVVREELQALMKYPRWELHGRRWFQRSAGNTYHVVRVYENGELVYTSPRTYGYGDSYIETAFDWLVSSGRLPKKERGHYSTIDLRETFGGDYSVEDVSRERDL